MNAEHNNKTILFSDANFLAVELLIKLIQNKINVDVVTDDIKNWKIKTSNRSLNNFTFVTLKNFIYSKDFTHAIFCGGFIKKNTYLKYFNIFLTNNNLSSSKNIAIFPQEIYPVFTKSRLNPGKNSTIFYVGDLLGEGLDLNSDLMLPLLINGMIKKRTLTLAVGEIFFPIHVKDVSKYIIEVLFEKSFGGKEIFLRGTHVPSGEFWKKNTKFFTDLKINYDIKLEPRKLIKSLNIITMHSSLLSLLNLTYLPLIQKKAPRTKQPIKKVYNPENKFNLGKRNFKKIILIFLSIFTIIASPLLASGVSLAVLYVSYNRILSGNIKNSLNYFTFSKKLFAISKAESDLFIGIPILGNFYKETSYVDYIGSNISEAASNAVPLLEESKDMVDNILGNEIYDSNKSSAQIKSGLDYLYRQLSLIQVETNQKSESGVKTAKKLQKLVDFDKFITLAQQGAFIVNKLPDILGAESNKDYLVLFENNMELRPTGGFIGSYGIASFGGGKLNGLSVNDIYSADGQLKGHIEPPLPIKDYLNEANWYFRDSNWDPDFTVSAQRAEWFLEKEMGLKVNGVVAVDLTPIKNILKYTGPIFLPDYDLTITETNLYEKTQQESQANFFPGSRKKASFLTALSRVLLNELSKMDSKQKIGILRVLYNGLESRDLQIFMHDENTQNSLSKLNWDGGVNNYSCGATCYSDFFGLVEANLGVNKANYFLKRKVDIQVNVGPASVVHKLSLNLDDTANQSLGLAGKYKAYVRLLIPVDATFSSAVDINGQTEKTLTYDVNKKQGYQEVGVWIEILPANSKKLVMSWTTDLPQNNIYNYGLYIRKQAGTDADPLNLNLKTNRAVVDSNPTLSLTSAGTYTYNTTLGKDFYLITDLK